MTELPPGICGPAELRALHRAHTDRYPFLLQSTAVGTSLGRYDILFAYPGDHLVLNADGQLGGHADDSGKGADKTGFLPALDQWWREERASTSDTKLPFVGGWFLYLGYELAAEIEPTLNFYVDETLPMAFAVRCRAAIIYDHDQDRATVVVEPNADIDADEVCRDLVSSGGQSADGRTTILSVGEDDPEQYKHAVRQAKKHIVAGDIYQANLSRSWTVTLSEQSRADDIYAALCDTNPAPFAGIAHWQDTSIISSSPERLIQVRDGLVSTRPIAGTRRRGPDDLTDSKLSSELFSNPKERAEHVMLIDLERNDLGRVCRPGTVEVDEMMVLESYAHVHHIVSNVRGELRTDVSPGESIAAVFPGGTITGCPKVRCMDIISEQEGASRGAYTGSFGYLNRDGSMDLNILIRTMVKRGKQLTFRAGAGIVADSDPQAELDEARAKAEGMLRALDHG